MQRYFVPEKNWKQNEVMITDDDAHHINRVMRFTAGERIICNHPSGDAAICVLIDVGNNPIVAAIDQWLDCNVELPVHVTIAQGLPKGDKFETVLQKGTELGAHGFIPFSAARSVVRWDDKKTEKKMTRFQKIVKEASEQSHRNKIPLIKPKMGLKELITESQLYDYKIFAYEEEAKKSDYNALSKWITKLERGQTLLACIGPEGGFSEAEAKMLKENGFMPVRLGPRILRTETAALYILSIISFYFEEMGC